MDKILNNVKIQSRIDTTAGWNKNNPVLLKNEVGIEITDTTKNTVKYKVGNGVTAWGGLKYTTPADGGKIDSISVNGVKQPIDNNKNVNLTISDAPDIKTFSNVSVSKSAFSSNTEIAQCPYKATVTLNGVTSAYSPIVNFNPDIQFSGIQWVVDCGTNSLILYASQIPSANFVIANVICTKIG